MPVIYAITAGFMSCDVYTDPHTTNSPNRKPACRYRAIGVQFGAMVIHVWTMDVYTLTKQMGTSVKMIELHYGHLQPAQKANVIAGKHLVQRGRQWLLQAHIRWLKSPNWRE